MKRVTAIFEHPEYQYWLKELLEIEQDRRFCRHTMEHFLAVARIVYIKTLEKNILVPKDLLYAAALLHDIGKVQQYTDGVPHELASERLARIILQETGFETEEIEQICSLILQHRKPSVPAAELEQLFYEADKASRDCYQCPMVKKCNWDEKKKNLTIEI